MTALAVKRAECMRPKLGLPRPALSAASSGPDSSVIARGDSRDSALIATMRSPFDHDNFHT